MTLDNPLPILAVPFFCDYCQCWIDQLPHNHTVPITEAPPPRKPYRPCKKDGRQIFPVKLSSGEIIQFPYYLYQRYTFIRMLVNDALYKFPTHQLLVEAPAKSS